MLSDRPTSVTLPSSVFDIVLPLEGPTPTVPHHRVQVSPRAVVRNAFTATQLNNKPIANALHVLPPLAGDIHFRFCLNLRGLGDLLSLNLRDEALRTLHDSLISNAQRIGVEGVTRLPPPHHSASDEEDCDLHYRVSPSAGLPEHHWFRAEMLAPNEPFLELAEMRIQLSWTKRPESSPGVAQSRPIIGQPGALSLEAHARAVLHQIRCGMRRILRLGFIKRFPLVFDDEFIRHVRDLERLPQSADGQYKKRLELPTALIQSLRNFTSVSAQHNRPLFPAVRDLLALMRQLQNTKLRRQLEAVKEAASTRGPKKRRTTAEGSVPVPDGSDHMGPFTDHVVNLDSYEDEDSAIECSIKRALSSLGISHWNCVRQGRSKAGAGRITLEQTPVPNTYHYDIRNQSGASLASGTEQPNNKYKPTLIAWPHRPFSTSHRVHQSLHLEETRQLGMYEPEQPLDTASFPSFSPVGSPSYLPPSPPRSKCCELPFLDDLEYDTEATEASGILFGRVHLETSDWSSSLPSPQQTPVGSPALSPLEIDCCPTPDNALCLDLFSAQVGCRSSHAAIASRLQGLGYTDELELDPNSPRATSVSPAIDPISMLGENDLSDDMSNVMFQFNDPELPPTPQSIGSHAASIISMDPSDLDTDDFEGRRLDLMTASGYQSPIPYGLGLGTDESSGQTAGWSSDMDFATSNETSDHFEDDLEDWEDETMQPYDLSPPGLDTNSDFDSDGPSVESPQETGVFLNDASLRSKRKGSDLWRFSFIEDDLHDEVSVTLQ